MLRTLCMVSVLRGCTRGYSTKAKAASTPITSRRPLDRRSTMARHRISEKRIEGTSGTVPNAVDQLEKLPTVTELALQAVRHESVSLQDTFRAFQVDSDGEITSDKLLMLLDILGSLARTYDRADYIQALNQIWAKRTSLEISISHYNAYLKAAMRVGMEVDMEKCLEEIAQLGLIPNGTTYQRFVENFCEQGQIDRALEIFSKMEAEGRTREVYHALIKGHSRSKDTTAAREILSQMKAQRIVPNSETYTFLARGLAECGEHAGVLEAVRKGKLSGSKMMTIFEATSDIKLKEELCTLISRSNLSIADAKRCCVELIHAKKLKEAQLIAEKLIRNKVEDLGFFSGQMVVSEYKADQVVEFCRSIECEKKRSAAIQAAVERAVHVANTPLGLEYLSAFRDEGFPIREHYFYPLICRAKAEGDAFAVLQRMHDWNLQDSEMPLTYLLARLIDEWRYKPVTAFSRVEQWERHQNIAKRALARYFVSCRKFQDCIENFDLLDASIWEQFVPIIAEHTTVENKSFSLFLMEKILNEAGSRENAIKEEYEQHLPENMARRTAPKLVKSTVLTYFQPRNSWLIEPTSNSEKDLSLLTYLCSKDDQDAVRDHLKKLNENYLKAPSYFSLINFYARAKNLDRVMYYFKRVRKDPENEFGDWIILTVVTLMIERGQYDSALQLVKKHEFRGNFKSSSSKSAKIAAVITESLRSAGFEATLEMVRVLIPKCRPIESKAVTAVVEHAIEHEPTRVMEVFKEMGSICGILVGVLKMYRHLIYRGLERDLKFVFEMARQKHGEQSAKILLAIAYILEHRTPEAKRILMSTRKDTSCLPQIRGWFEGFLRRDQIAELEMTLRVFSECGFRYEPLYLMLAEAYAREGNVEKADKLWLNANACDMSLSNQTLSKIAQCFEAKGMKPPFSCKA